MKEDEPSKFKKSNQSARKPKNNSNYSWGYFTCNGPQRVHDFPKNEKINVFVVDDENENDKEYASKVTPIQLLNILTG